MAKSAGLPWDCIYSAEGLIDSRCKRGGGGLPMMRWPAGALRRYPAARGDENIDDMVTRGRFECRER
jgi:hypothetical protein